MANCNGVRPHSGPGLNWGLPRSRATLGRLRTAELVVRFGGTRHENCAAVSRLAAGCLALALAALALTLTVSARQPAAAGPAIDPDDIGGVVTGPKGPEAGVWVIAETRDLPVRYIKSVVTDDRGRFVVPDLPAASYSVWARGYGLVDSAKATAKPGQHRQHHRRCRRPTRPPPRTTTRPSTGTRC